MSFNEIECHVNTSLGLLGEDASLRPPWQPCSILFMYMSTHNTYFLLNWMPVLCLKW